MAKPEVEAPQPDRLVGVESRKSYPAKLQNGFVEKYLSGAHILDIGYRGYDPDVVPIVPQAIGVELDYPGYDGRTLPFPDGSQDAVFSSHCLEHAEDCRAALTEWFRVLKIGGFIVLAVPHKYMYERRERPPSRWNLDHRRFFTPGTLMLRVEQALAPNTYRLRHLADNDVSYSYGVSPPDHPSGCYEIELVIEKIAEPAWQFEQPTLEERKTLINVYLAPAAPNAAVAGSERPLGAGHRIAYDGVNLGLLQGTGIATYTRTLAQMARGLGYDVDIIHETPFAVPDDPVLQDVLFFDQGRVRKRRPSQPSLSQRLSEATADLLHRAPKARPVPVRLGDVVDARQFADILPADCRVLAAQAIFSNAARWFGKTGRLASITLSKQADIFHCTYPMPVTVRQARNIVTIHDLVPLRLPQSTADDKRGMYRLLKAVVANADHIVTVSEASKRDIVSMLGVDERRVTNTYQSVAFADEDLARSDDAVANHLAGLYGLEMNDYLLFFGALEPKKNVSRLIDAYLSSGVERPLVLVTGPGWMNDVEEHRLAEIAARAAGGRGPAIRRLDFVPRSHLVNLIRGARAVVFPSLLEGFGLPVLEAMTLGTPVITSAGGALEEIAGEAALLVDPYDADAIARALVTVDRDVDLCGELSQRGMVRANWFSLPRYRERLAALYAALT